MMDFFWILYNPLGYHQIGYCCSNAVFIYKMEKYLMIVAEQLIISWKQILKVTMVVNWIIFKALPEIKGKIPQFLR